MGGLVKMFDLISVRAREGSVVVLGWVKAYLIVSGNEAVTEVGKAACQLPREG